MKKKILALALVVAMLAVAIVSASLAYFTDEDYATNTFTVGEVDIDLEEDFGNDDNIDDTDTDKENFYPGVAVNKDVWVVNTSETGNSAYVRVHVAFPVELAPRTATTTGGVTTYEYDIAGDDGLAIVTLYDGATTEEAYEEAWVWDADPYFAKIGQDAANQIDCVVFVATYQKVLAAGDKTVVDAISAVTLNPWVDSDMTTDANTTKDELVLYLDINTKNGKFDGVDNELWVKAQGDAAPNFTIDIEVAAEAVQIQGLETGGADAALDTAFGVPGTYVLSDATDENPILWTDCIAAKDENGDTNPNFPSANP
jgi:predicted ribosomally synthesized peptide with SipW-like signal peptide